MRRDVSQQQHTDRAEETLRALVRLLARAAAHDALAATPQSGVRLSAERPEVEDGNAE